ncbi:hypothetical protein ZBPBA_01952 [Brucella abortus]|nr:hypothetical protein ZBPBA_01952 [Brucella abortus]
MSNATLNYTITTSQAIMFDNANSYIQIQVSPLDGSSEAAYVELPDEVANDRHIQKMFSSTEGGTVTNGVLFDIFSTAAQSVINAYKNISCRNRSIINK